jgi:hypothetical protein
MTTSGTVARTTVSTAEFIERALIMVGKESASITPEIVKQAKQALYMYLASLSNSGVNLWTIETRVFGILPGKTAYTLPTGAIDELNVFYRVPEFGSDATKITSSAGGTVANLVDANYTTVFTQTSKNGSISYDFTTAKAVRYFSVLSNGLKYHTFTAQYSFDNLTWFTIQVFDKNAMCPDGDWTSFNIDTPFPARYFRIVEGGGETISMRQLLICTGGSDVMLTRVNLDDYSNITDKERAGRQPTLYFLDRKAAAPVIRPWTVPSYMNDQLYYYYSRQIQDVGSLSQEIEIPNRWQQAVLENFALKLLLSIPGTDLSRHALIKEAAMVSLQEAKSQETDKAPMEMIPNIGVYSA